MASTAFAQPSQVQVPFGCGYAFPVSQTHNVGSHLQNDTWAWDFRMPEGTPVVAAAAGVVRVARGDSAEGGCDPKFAPYANYVVLDHRDGLESQYLHFSSVSVKPGQQVKAGELLGYSGKTGWACGAHLHFKVARHDGDGWNNPSVKATLAGYGDPSLESTVAGPRCVNPGAFIASRGAVITPEATLRAALATAARPGVTAEPEDTVSWQRPAPSPSAGAPGDTSGLSAADNASSTVAAGGSVE